MKKKKNKTLLVSILSLSLLTVMAGAAVAPALGIIKAYFSDVNPLFVQMIISVPAIFIMITNLCFPKLCRIFSAKTLVIGGLVFYTVGGCLAGAFDSIFLVLGARALVGIGVGIIMPMSTGLLAFYFPPEDMERLMGYSSAMNQMGGALATLLSGLFAVISWRASFLVYLLGFFSFLLCLFFLPKENPHTEDSHFSLRFFSEYRRIIIAMFLLMLTFFIYPTNFAMEINAAGVIPQGYIAVIMAGMDIVAFCSGFFFVYIKIGMREKTRLLAPLHFFFGYFFLTFFHGWFGVLAGSFCIGFGNGMGIPYLISTASIKAGKAATTTVMPLISLALYGAQFITPMVISVVGAVFSQETLSLPYLTAMVFALAFLFCSVGIKDATL